MRPAPRLESFLNGARASKDPQQSLISFVTAGLGVDSIPKVILQIEFLDRGPRSRPRRRILHRAHGLDHLRAGTGPALDEMQILAGSEEIRLGTEIGDVDDQRVSLPVAPRVPPPLADL